MGILAVVGFEMFGLLLLLPTPVGTTPEIFETILSD